MTIVDMPSKGAKWKESWDDETEFSELPQEVQVPRRMSFAPEVLQVSRPMARTGDGLDQGLMARPPGWTEVEGRPCDPPAGATGAEVRFHADLWDLRTTSGLSTLAERQAEGLCSGCPVRVECLEAALEEEAGLAPQYRFLVRGGFTPRARAQMERGRATA